MFRKYTCFYLTYFIVSVVPISLRGLVRNEPLPNRPFLTVHNYQKRPGVESDGIFERFVRNYLDELSTGFSGRDVVKYFRIVHRAIKELNLDHKYKEQLSEHFRYLARMHRDEVQVEIMGYRKDFDHLPPNATRFLETMNELFTLRENQLFDDYIYDLINYASGSKLYIQNETTKLIEDVILKNVYKMSKKDRIHLERNLKWAIREYTGGH